MRAKIWILGALLVTLGQVSASGCGGTESTVTCDEGGCECRDRTSCSLDCGDIVGCLPSCTAVKDDCTATCTADDCEYRCLSADNCDGLCGDNCTVRCSTVEQTCRAETGIDSDVSCTNVNNCAVEIGDGSLARCTSVNNCVVRCLGTCTVACADTETCSIDCRQGELLNCGGGLYTCDMPCP
jgi:hypothetical protein